MEHQIIKTSEKKWLAKLSEAYHKKQAVIIVDDADTGINPKEQTILQMGRKVNLLFNEWVAVLIALGMSATGAVMVVFGILDPEPTSKLGLLIGGGITAFVSGGFMAIKILTNQKPPKVTVNKKGFTIEWN